MRGIDTCHVAQQAEAEAEAEGEVQEEVHCVILTRAMLHSRRRWRWNAPGALRDIDTCHAGGGWRRLEGAAGGGWGRLEEEDLEDVRRYGGRRHDATLRDAACGPSSS